MNWYCPRQKCDERLEDVERQEMAGLLVGDTVLWVSDELEVWLESELQLG